MSSLPVAFMRILAGHSGSPLGPVRHRRTGRDGLGRDCCDGNWDVGRRPSARGALGGCSPVRNINATLYGVSATDGVAMSPLPTTFWEDLAEDLQDPEFLRGYVRESIRIATIDELVNALDEAREAAGLSKAALARAIGADPAVVRRLFSAGHVNPTLGTLAEVAAALGMKVTLQPLPPQERRQVTQPLLEGRAADPEALAEHMAAMRRTRRGEALAG